MTSDTLPTSLSATHAWARLRHELFYLVMAVMDMALIVPLALGIFPWLAQWPLSRLALGVLAGILLPYLIARLLTWARLPLSTQRPFLLISGIATILLTAGPLLFGTASPFDFSWVGMVARSLNIRNAIEWQRFLSYCLVLLASWWRGMLLLTWIADAGRLGVRLQRGALYVVPLALVLATFRHTASILPFVVLFLLAGLTAVALARAEAAEKAHAAILASLSPRWLLSITGGGTLLLLLASLVALLIGGDDGSRLSALLSPVRLAIQGAVATTGLTLIYLLSPFLGVLDRFFQLLLGFWQWVLARTFVPTGETQPPPEDSIAILLDYLNRMIAEQAGQPANSVINWRVVLFVVLLLAMLAALLLLARYYNRNRAAVSNGRFGRVVDGVMGRVTRNGRGRRPKAVDSDLPELDWRAAITIERIYRQMSAAARQLGHTRPKTQTPYEYRHTLSALWPELEQETKRITDAYVRVRYGLLPETPAEFEQIKQDWQRIEATAKAQIRQKTA